MRKAKLISNFITSQPGKQTIAVHILLNTSRSKSNETMKFSLKIKFSISLDQ